MGADLATLQKYHAAEKIYARCTMLEILGCLILELLAKSAELSGCDEESIWFYAAAQILSEGGLNYLGNPGLTHVQSMVTAFISTLLILGAAEAYPSDGSVDEFGEVLNNLYPDGPFDPLGLAEDPDTFAELKVKEINNGRLAYGNSTGSVRFPSLSFFFG